DPNRTQAAQVKDCTVKFDRLRAILQKESRRDTPGNLVRKRFKPEIDDAKKAIEKEVLNIKVPFPFIPQPISINDMINNTFPNFPLPAHDLVRNLGLKFKEIATKVVDETFDKLLDEIAGAVNSTQTEEWLLRVGVNGRWQTRFLGNIDDKELPIPDAYEFNISLGPDDQLFFSSGGVEFNPVGDMIRANRTD